MVSVELQALWNLRQKGGETMSLDLDFTAIFTYANQFLGALWPIIALSAGVAFAIYLGKLIISVFKGGLG